MAARRPISRLTGAVAAAGTFEALPGHDWRQRRAAFFLGRRKSSCQGPLRFGFITDIQYADVDDVGKRRYRNVLNIARNASQWFRERNVDFVVHAGDIIDERQAKQGLAASESAFAAIEESLSSDGDILCLIGNHELYNFSRERLKEISMQSSHRFVDASGSFYYRYEPPEALAAGWRFLILDSYDFSLLSGGRGAPPDQAALSYMAKHNPNFKHIVGDARVSIRDINQSCIAGVKFNWFRGLERGLLWRWVPMNGSFSDDQLEWLRAELAEATHLGLKVGLLAHVGVHPRTGGEGKCLTWDYDKIMRLLHSAEGTCVQVVFTGHRHDGGFVTDELGIHHCNFESPLLNKPGEPGAFAMVELHPDRILIQGYAPGRGSLDNQGCGRTLDAEDAHVLQTRELALRARSPPQ